MKITYGMIALLMLTRSIVAQEMEYFSSPGPNRSYKAGDTIPFIIDDMPDEEDQTVNANLHKSDGTFIKTLKSWTVENIDESGEEFPFNWPVDVDESGSYYVEVAVGNSREDATRSYTFTVETDEAGTGSEESDVDAATPQNDMSTEDESGPYRQQEEPEEMEEPSEHVAPPQQQQHKKLTQHNQGNRVAHILSHNLIDPVEQTLSGVTGKKHSGDSNEASAPGSHLAAKLPSLVADKISKTTQADAVGSVTDKLKSVTGDIATKVGAEGVFQPLMPAIKPNDSLKALKAADKIAIAQEKAWIAKQKSGASRTGGNSASKKVAHGNNDAPSSSPKPTKLMVHQQDADDDREKAKDEAEKKQDEQEKKSKEDREKAEDKRKENFEKFEVERQKLSLEQQEKLEEQLEHAHEMQQSPKKAVQASTEQPKPTSHQQGHLVDPKVTSATLHKAKQIQAAAASNKANETKAQKKEKRDAYRHVLRNRARFAKRILQ